MIVNAVRLYIDTIARSIIAGRGSMLGLTLPVTIGDLVHFQIQGVTAPIFNTDSDGYAESSRADFVSAGIIQAALVFKTPSVYESGGDFVQSVNAFDATQDWHSPVNGRWDIPCVLELADVDPGLLNAGLIGFDALGNRTHLGQVPLLIEAIQPVWTDTESTQPTGTPQKGVYSGIITAGNSSVDITVTGMTSNGESWPKLLGTSTDLTTIWAVEGADKVTVFSAGPAPVGGHFDVKILVTELS